MSTNQHPAAFRGKRLKALWAMLASACAVAVFAAAAPAWAQTTTISQGHVDVLAFGYDSSAEQLTLELEYGSNQYDPSSVILDVHDGHKVDLSSAINCVANAGVNWLIPDSYSTGKLFAGWNTDGLNLSDFVGGSIKAELVSASTPAGGAVSIYDFTSGQFHIRFHSDSNCVSGPTTINEVHHHPSWVFTKAGVYELTFQVSGEHKTDGQVTSSQVKYTFHVGQ